MRNSKILRIIIISAAVVTCAGGVILFLKRRDILRRFFTFALITAVITGGLVSASMTVYAANTETDITENITELAPETVEEITVDLNEFLNLVPEPTSDNSKILTPTGNLTLVDDLSGEQTGDKQVITVTTKNGNYFYIIIDHASGKDNVHFLNIVDEADLMALLKGENTEKPVTTTEAITEQAPAPAEIVAVEPKKSNTTGLLIMFALIAAVGGGAYYYFKIRKPKQGTTKSAVKSELDEFKFDADEDDIIKIDTGEVKENPEHDSDADEEIPDFGVKTSESEDDE